VTPNALQEPAQQVMVTEDEEFEISVKGGLKPDKQFLEALVCKHEQFAVDIRKQKR
jgi:hypothetical protein